MSATTDRAAFRIGGFVAVLAVLFGAAFGVGRLVDDEPATLSSSYRLQLADGVGAGGPAEPVRFTIVDQDDQVVTEFDVRHEKKLHLIAVRDDFSGFQHVHPTMAADGTWSVPLDVRDGEYRLFADFAERGGSPRVAYADLPVSGQGAGGASSIPQVTRSTTVDGYTVALSGSLVAGAGTTLTLSVSRGGEAVTDLEPYLGAYGHLVVLRGTDKQYLHAHPTDGPAGPEIGFHVEVPTQDRYYLYLDFQHGGKVRTAQFALDASGSGAAENEDDHGGH